MAAIVVALAPLTIQFSDTAFGDPLLTFWLMAALCAVAALSPSPHPRAGAVLPGVLFGLALATKVSGIHFLAFADGDGLDIRLERAGMVTQFDGIWFGLRASCCCGRSRGRRAKALSVCSGPTSAAYVWRIRGELWPRLLQTARLWRVSLGWLLTAAFGATALGMLVWSRRRRFHPLAVEPSFYGS